MADQSATARSLRPPVRPLMRLREEMVLVAFGAWMIVGLFLDGWAHSTQRPDGFFTPWHGVLYTGFTGAAATALWQVRRRHRPGAPWGDAITPGYGLSLVGLVLFALAAGGDLVWHQALGVEVSLAALLSPTHLVLMIGAVLALSGPLRTVWLSADPPTRLREFFPALLSVTLAAGVGVFFTMYASPFGQAPAALYPSTSTDIHDFSRVSPAAFAQLREMWGLAAILVTTVLLLVPALVLTLRWRPPAGSLVIYFTLVGILETANGEFRRWPLVFSGVLAGVVAELLNRHRASPIVFASIVPVALWSGYFAALQVAYGVQWDAELWAGAIVLSAVVGAGLGLLMTVRPGVRRDVDGRSAGAEKIPERGNTGDV